MMTEAKVPEAVDQSGECRECAAQSHPFKCFICEHDGSLEYYRTKATLEELCSVIIGIKLCTKHATELDKIQSERKEPAAA